MSDPVSIKREDVDRLAEQCEFLAREDAAPIHDSRCAATLRALVAERDALTAIRDEERAALNNALDLRARHIDGLTTLLDRTETERDAAQAEVARLRGLLYEARHSGLIYWEPQTDRGRVAQADMMRRIDAALAGGSEDE